MKNKIKQQFSELRETTPKYIQWLLLGVAFVVVLILLTLLLSGDDKDAQAEVEKTNTAAAKLTVKPEEIKWTDIVVGKKETQTIKIASNIPVTVVSTTTNKEVSGLSVKETCASVVKKLSPKVGCNVILTYQPTQSQETTQTEVLIKWHNTNAKEETAHTTIIPIELSAKMPPEEKKTEPKPEPVVEPEPEPVVEPEPEPIKEAVEVIAPPIVIPEPEPEPEPSESCSDFAFPGYNMSGRQIGWIKPSRGAYKFHPFSDKECENPTGTYNPDNGIITDDDGKKIGTDADHIGYAAFNGGALPELSNAPAVRQVNRARQSEEPGSGKGAGRLGAGGWDSFGSKALDAPKPNVTFDTTGTAVVSTQPYDRSFVLRQFKPIPATIVSDVRADIKMLQSEGSLPVRATVDRNVYSDNGRTVIIPTGTLLMGYVTGEIPGPYKTIGRMKINWSQFILPNGVEFNFKEGEDPFSADAQGRVGVPGRGSSDYLEQFVMPMLTAFVPATINLINPIADAFVNQIDLDNNTVVQSGTMRSSELAKNEIITAWNSVAQKLLVDMMDNTVPPFTIPAGTRITVYSPVDLQVACEEEGKDCYVSKDSKNQPNDTRRDWGKNKDVHNVHNDVTINENDPSWVGQARSFVADAYCEEKDGVMTVKAECATNPESCGGYSYSTLLMWCKSQNYESKKALQYEAYREDQKQQYQEQYGTKDNRTEEQQTAYNEMIGIKYDDDGHVVNPYANQSTEKVEEVGLLCEDGTPPDGNGCCTGEIYTDMGDQGFNCCPQTGGDCFPPLI